MPEDKKSKNDPKEQRRSKRRHDARVEKRNEKQSTPATNQVQEVPKVTVPEKPAYVAPGPEFYKSLKRETDEILKITEEENMKYKKKEIQSNWAKYEMPIESYNEIEEQENIGADYETLIQAPLSVGGHFQFKHEKSWDVDTGPSLYDKYFEIDMDTLALALSTIPFYERSNIDKSNFNEADIFNMDNRATKFKQKYYNDQKYTTPELEAEENILNKLTSSEDKNEKDNEKENPVIFQEKNEKTIDIEQLPNFTKDPANRVGLKSENSEKLVEMCGSPAESEEICRLTTHNNLEPEHPKEIEKTVTVYFETNGAELKNTQLKNSNQKHKNKLVDDIDDIIEIVGTQPDSTEIKFEADATLKDVNVEQVTKVSEDATTPVKEEPKLNPVIASPEDLEKWLDDFLEGKFLS
ncbi:unnamed protein product, partial [Iphiclides podalirius]